MGKSIKIDEWEVGSGRLEASLNRDGTRIERI